MGRLAFGLAFLLVLVACERRRDESSSAAAEGQATTEANTTESPGTPAPMATEVRSVEEASVRGFVEEWLAAQNERDFARYETLYAERFEGVKRSGPRSYRLVREGWLEDRRRMFARPMQVEAGELRIARAAGSAVVRFEQRFASPTYRDVGEKQLVLVPTAAGLRIAREEMLDSTIVTASSAKGATEDVFLITLGDPRLVVLGAADARIGIGPPRVVSRTGPMTVLREVAKGGLPSAIAAYEGQRVALVAESGPRCLARLGKVRLLRRVDPHFGTVQAWNGEDTGVPATPAQIASEAWELASIGSPEGADTFFAANLEGVPPECEGALLARPVDANEPLVLTKRPAASNRAARAIAAFRALPAHRQLQRELETQHDGKGWWDAYEGASPEVFEWADAKGEPRLVVVHARAGTGCGSFGGSLTALFEVANEKLVLLSEKTATHDFEPLAIVDLEGDGTFEIVAEDRLLGRTTAGYVPLRSIAPAFLDCPC